jgi:very-short-patch-repair endonuclease
MSRSETTVARARELRKQQTNAESALWRRLRARRFHGVKFRRQYPIGPFVVDFCCAEAALVIEIDGGQHAANRRADASRTRYLNELGYTVLRFWNNEVLAAEESALARIADALGLILSPRLRGTGENPSSPDKIPSPRLRGEG